MKKLLALSLAFAMMLTTSACSSNEFHVILTMANSGADYVAVVAGHPEAEVAIDAAFKLAGAEYDSYVAGTSTIDKVTSAVQTFANSLDATFKTFNISDAKTIGLTYRKNKNPFQRDRWAQPDVRGGLSDNRNGSRAN